MSTLEFLINVECLISLYTLYSVAELTNELVGPVVILQICEVINIYNTSVQTCPLSYIHAH